MQASIQFLQVENTPPRPRRFLRREWKRNKPHLPKSTSLPILQLTPIDRPIFTCRQCGFINTLIPLCLWCCWTSDVAHHEFEMSMPRVRRASAPSRVFWKHNANTAATSSKASSAQAVSDRVSSGIKTVSGHDIPSDRFRDNKFRARDRQVQSNAEADQRGRTSPNLGGATRHNLKRHHNNVVHETFFDAVRSIQDRVTKVTSSASSAGTQLNESRPHAQTLGARLRRPISLCLSIQPSSTLPPRHSPSPKDVDHPHTMDHIQTFSTKSLRSIPIVIDFKDVDESRIHDLIKSKSVPNNLCPAFPPKTLRRKKGVSLFHASPPQSAPSIHAPLILPLPERPETGSHVKRNLQNPDHIPLSLSASSSHTQTDVRSKSNSTASVPLGHPNRPYYSAIRPNMSRPSSLVGSSYRPQSSLSTHPSRPLSLPPHPRAPSPGILSVLSTSSVFSRSVFEEDEYVHPVSPASAPSSAYDHVHQPPFTFAGSMSRHRVGFSLSGETELRMAISRDQDKMLGPGMVEETFKFRDMKKTSRRETRVMESVHKLKKGLKEFVLKAL